MFSEPTTQSAAHLRQSKQTATAASENVFLNATGLSCTRGERELFSGLSLQLAEQQCLHVIGSNGSGKSSLLRILSGLNQADSGEVYWQGKVLAESSDFYQRSAFIGHKDGLKNELTAVENLRFYQRLEGQKSEQLIDQHLARMGILRCADLTANKLSFGQRRRLAFARLLQGHCKLWILDEPLTGIDAQGRDLIEQIFIEHLQAGGMMIVTNHQSLASSPIADHLLELQL